MEGFFAYLKDPMARKLAEALAKLMEKQPFDDITTSGILEEAKVSRSTFYRRYHDKYDLLTRNYQEHLDETICRIPDGKSFREAFFSLYQALKGYPSFFRNALASNEPNGLKNYIAVRSYEMYDTILRRQGLDMDSTYYKLLLTGYIKGSLEVTYIWVEQGMNEPIDLIFRISYELLPHEFQVHLALFYM